MNGNFLSWNYICNIFSTIGAVLAENETAAYNEMTQLKFLVTMSRLFFLG